MKHPEGSEIIAKDAAKSMRQSGLLSLAMLLLANAAGLLLSMVLAYEASHFAWGLITAAGAVLVVRLQAEYVLNYLINGAYVSMFVNQLLSWLSIALCVISLAFFILGCESPIT